METTTSRSTTETTEVRIVDGPIVTDLYSGGRFRVDYVRREVQTFADGEVLTHTTVKGFKVRKDGQVTEQRSYQDICGDEAEMFAATLLETVS